MRLDTSGWADLDWHAVTGVSKRKALAVPEWVATAFNLEAVADGPARRKAWLDLRALLVGEGAYTSAGALAFGPLLDCAAGPTAAPVRLWTLLLDLVWGSEVISARGLPPGTPKKGPQADLLGAARAAVPRLEAWLGAPEPTTRSGAALVLGALQVPSPCLVAACAEEADDTVRVALLVALAGGRPPGALALALAALEPPEPPEVRLAASIAALVLAGAEAPDLARATIATFGDLTAEALPLPAGLGWLGQQEALAEPRARALLTDAVLRRVDRVLADPERSGLALSWALGDLGTLLDAWLAGHPSAEALPPIARRVVERTLHPAFAGRPRFEGQGLPAGVPARRRWLGRPGPADGVTPEDLRAVRAWEEAFEEVPPIARETLSAMRVVLARLPLAVRRDWARSHLAGRTRWPGATRAPNQEAALLALEQLDDAELERTWIADKEAVLAALTGEGPEVLALLARLPRPRRLDAWRRIAAAEPNPAVGLRRALALAPACPYDEVALELVGLSFRLPGGPAAAPLDALFATLDTLGAPGTTARAALAALAGR